MARLKFNSPKTTRARTSAWPVADLRSIRQLTGSSRCQTTRRSNIFAPGLCTATADLSGSSLLPQENIIDVGNRFSRCELTRRSAPPRAWNQTPTGSPFESRDLTARETGVCRDTVPDSRRSRLRDATYPPAALRHRLGVFRTIESYSFWTLWNLPIPAYPAHR